MKREFAIHQRLKVMNNKFLKLIDWSPFFIQPITVGIYHMWSAEGKDKTFKLKPSPMFTNFYIKSFIRSDKTK